MKVKGYNKSYYDLVSAGSLISAQEVIPVVMQYIIPRSVIDIGCGVGAWLSVWSKKGVRDISGIDGDYVDVNQLMINKENFSSGDIEKELNIQRQYELVMSLEVAEHLKPEAAPVFIRSLCQLGEVILFSAAIPHQEGVMHINEQYPDYWIKLFAQHGYSPYDCIRDKIWNNVKIDVCYRQNMLFFIKDSAKDKFQSITKENKSVLSLVHPDHYEFKQREINSLKHVLKTPFHTAWFFFKKYCKLFLKSIGLYK
jgi:cyclopropane fatty-acyl-phospholipid synthase-like methyltransferase